jgi:hypothetical protein
MKVIGLAGRHNDVLICEVTTDELKRLYVAQYGSTRYAELERVTAGQVFDLSQAPAFRQEIARSADIMKGALTDIEKLAPNLLRYLQLCAVTTPPNEEQR